MCLESFVLKRKRKEGKQLHEKHLKWDEVKDHKRDRKTESKAYEIVIKRHILK